ncbi:MAG: AraC family transcriptional regulator [Lachnospiraceae bacterium]|nr:AraC family transcriptional regulator [Lachnospiraceae bacterium]
MDLSNYESLAFHGQNAFNLATGIEGRSFPMHWHSYGEIILVGAGETNDYQVGQTVYHLVKDDFVLIWPTEMHAILDADRKNSLVLQFSNAFASSQFDFQRIMHYYHDLHVLCSNAHPELTAALKALALKMRDLYFSDDRDREIKCCILLMQFMIALDENRDVLTPDMRSADGEPGSGAAGTLQRMIEVTDYIKTHLTDDDLSQNTMAAMAGITPEHFSRIFKNVTGQNYSKWLNMIRLEKAISLFSEKGMSLTEIAMLSGFQSIPTFNRVFRDAKGMSPGEYRSLYAQNSRS